MVNGSRSGGVPARERGSHAGGLPARTERRHAARKRMLQSSKLYM